MLLALTPACQTSEWKKYEPDYLEQWPPSLVPADYARVDPSAEAPILEAVITTLLPADGIGGIEPLTRHNMRWLGNNQYPDVDPGLKRDVSAFCWEEDWQSVAESLPRVERQDQRGPTFYLSRPIRNAAGILVILFETGDGSEIMTIRGWMCRIEDSGQGYRVRALTAIDAVGQLSILPLADNVGFPFLPYH